MAWMSIVGDVARSHGWYVEPQFRRDGIMRDNLQARLIHLKSRRAHTLVNEISETNAASSEHAARSGERIAGKIYLYVSPEAPKENRKWTISSTPSQDARVAGERLQGDVDLGRLLVF